MELIEVHVSCPDEELAGKIARLAVDARLAACAHILPMRSIYRWKDEVEDEGEWSVSLKSRSDLFERLSSLIREAHSYELPAIMWRPCGADAETAAWIAEVTS